MSGFIMWLSGAWVILERAQNEELHHPNYSDNPMLGSVGLYRRSTGLEGLTMTENQIEIIVERAIDKLDARLMQSKITQLEYDYEVSIIDKWATQQYEHSKVESV